MNFNGLLRFIYTGRVKLCKGNAASLLTAADKYLIPLLKSKCEEFIINHLTTENCIEMLTLADQHSALHLKKSTIELIHSRRTEIVNTESWKNLKISHPHVAIDVVEHLLMK